MALTMTTSTDTYIFCEFFPIDQTQLPPLFTYTLNVSDAQNAQWVGRSLAYRLRHLLPGHWAWAEGQLVSTVQASQDTLTAQLETLWQNHPDSFQNLHAIEVAAAPPSLQGVAELVAGSMLDAWRPAIQQVLADFAVDLGKARLKRFHEASAWVVQGQPAVALSVSSQIELKQSLSAFGNSQPNWQDVMGLWVADRHGNLKGEIVAALGPLSDHRRRLEALTKDETHLATLRQAADSEQVVQVRVGSKTYDYPAYRLDLIVRTGDMKRFGINGAQATQSWRLAPQTRADMIKALSKLVKAKLPVQPAYATKHTPQMFLDAQALGFRPEVRVGKNHVLRLEARTLLAAIQRHGMFQRHPSFPAGATLKVAVLNATRTQPDTRQEFLNQLTQRLKGLGVVMVVAFNREVTTTSREKWEEAVQASAQAGAQLVLAFLPDEVPAEDDDEHGLYHTFKTLTVGRGLPSQVVQAKTLTHKYALDNIVLGVLGKIGHTPYTLAHPLPYADLVVGIDIGRQATKRRSGSLSLPALTRVYLNDGRLLRYTIADHPIEGETIPPDVLKAMFPAEHFAGKRVLVQRDGLFRGAERATLGQWGHAIGAQFLLMEVRKNGNPRLYASQMQDGKLVVKQPPTGSFFKVDDQTGFLVSSLPPFENATPQPLQLRADPPLTIEQAAHATLSLTLLHFGSLRPPRLPVTLHFSDRMAYLAMQGIKPPSPSGDVPYWL